MSKDTIRALSQKEQAREKVSVWFGSKENYYHPFIEVLLNGADEINNNFNDGTIIVKLHENQKMISVSDTGRGLPIEGKTDGVNNYELLLLTLFAGTNYDNNENGKETTGTNGVGLTVTNYCSKYFSATSKRNHKQHKIVFSDGGEILEPLTSTKNDDETTGTTITFELDDTVFSHTKYDVEEIKNIIKRTAGACRKITFKFEHNNETIIYKYDDLEDYFKEINHNNTSGIIVASEKMFNLENETNKMELIFTTSPDNIQQSFLNGTFLKEGGSINDGIVAGVKTFVNKYCKEKKMLNDKIGNISDDDVRDSLSFVCNFKSTKTEFANQTKFSTNKKLYENIAKQYVQTVLEIHKIEQPKEFEKLVNHILEVQKFNSSSIANKNALKKKLSEKINNFTKIEGLVDCKQHGENAEIFICEGKSALGSVVTARNPIFQAGVAIRGKITNCLKTSLNEIFKSQIVIDLIKILGCGIETDRKNKDLGAFDESALRYGKIIIATDMDADGYQIACLLLTMFYRLTPKLIEHERIYIALTPLFEIKDMNTNKSYYAFSEEEKENIISKLDRYKISRNKGLGELDAKIMSETGVNPETRTIVKVTMDNARAMSNAFDIWMNETVTERKNIIMNELDKYTDID